MLDQLISRHNNHRFVLSTAAYTPSKALKSRTFGNCNQDKLAVLFSPWHGGGRYYERLTHRLESSGWSVICYDFSPEILKPDIMQVIASFKHLQMIISDDLHAVTAQNSYRYIHFISASLGSVPLALVAEQFRDFSEITMVVASSNLARGTWEGLRTQAIREAFITQNITEAELDVAWASLAPKNHVEAYAHKPVSLIISKTDQVIPTKFQLEYQTAVNEANAKLTTSYTHLGHYASISKFCLFGKIPG